MAVCIKRIECFRHRVLWMNIYCSRFVFPRILILLSFVICDVRWSTSTSKGESRLMCERFFGHLYSYARAVTLMPAQRFAISSQPWLFGENRFRSIRCSKAIMRRAHTRPANEQKIIKIKRMPQRRMYRWLSIGCLAQSFPTQRVQRCAHTSTHRIVVELNANECTKDKARRRRRRKQNTNKRWIRSTRNEARTRDQCDTCATERCERDRRQLESIHCETECRFSLLRTDETFTAKTNSTSALSVRRKDFWIYYYFFFAFCVTSIAITFQSTWNAMRCEQKTKTTKNPFSTKRIS